MKDLRYKIQLAELVLTAEHIDGTTSAVFAAQNGVFDVSQTFCFAGAAYDIIERDILSKPRPWLESVPVLITEPCCNDGRGNDLVLFDGVISGKDIEQCKTETRCTVCATLTPRDVVSEKIACLKNHFIWDTESIDGTITTLGADEYRESPRIEYCSDPSFTLMILGVWVISVLAPLALVVAVIIAFLNVLIDIFNAIPLLPDIPNIDFDGNDDTSIFTELFNLISDMQESITGCGRKHAAPFVHSYLENACKLCGLTLKSSLFESGGVYHNTMRLDAAQEGGDDENAGIINAWEINKPNLNAWQFLNSFEQFNIEWQINEGCELCIEHEDDIRNNGSELLDMQLLESDVIESFCVKYGDGNELCAYGVYEYSEDGLDLSADEVRRRWADFVIDWNDPINANQAGECKKVFSYGAAQFRNDALRIKRQAIDGFLNVFYPNTNGRDNNLLLKSDTAALPKLLIWDGISDPACALVTRRADGELWQYNIPWRISANPILGENTAYQNLLYSDNPQRTTGGNRSFTLVVRPTCEQKLKMRNGQKCVIVCGRAVFNAKVSTATFDGRVLTIEGSF